MVECELNVQAWDFSLKIISSYEPEFKLPMIIGWAIFGVGGLCALSSSQFIKVLTLLVVPSGIRSHPASQADSYGSYLLLWYDQFRTGLVGVFSCYSFASVY